MLSLKDKVAREICATFTTEGATCRPLCADCRATATRVAALFTEDMRKRYGCDSRSAAELDAIMGVE